MANKKKSSKKSVSGNKMTLLCRELIDKEDIGSEGGYEPTFKSNLDLVDYFNGRYESNGKVAVGFNGGKILTIIGKPGSGKAQPLDSIVKTPETDTKEIRMGDIKVGTKVYDGNGKISKVTNIFPQGTKSNYRVVFTDNTSMECNDEHLFSVIREVCKFNEINIGDKIISPIDDSISEIKEIYYNENNGEIDYLVTNEGKEIEYNENILFEKYYGDDKEYKVISLKDIANNGIYVDETSSTFKYEIPMYVPSDINKLINNKDRDNIFDELVKLNIYNNEQLLFTSIDSSIRVFRFGIDKFIVSEKYTRPFYYLDDKRNLNINSNNDIIFTDSKEMCNYVCNKIKNKSEIYEKNYPFLSEILLEESKYTFLDNINYFDLEKSDNELITFLKKVIKEYSSMQKVYTILYLFKLANKDYNNQKRLNTFTSFNKEIIKLIKDIVESIGGICFLNKDEVELLTIQVFIKREYIMKSLFDKDYGSYYEFYEEDFIYFSRFCDVEPTRHIKDIEYIGETEMQCIMLDDDSNHTYATDSYIITHNTTIGLKIAASIVEPYEEGSIIHFDFENATSRVRFKAVSCWTDKMIDDKYTKLKENIYTETLYKFIKATSKIKLENYDEIKIDSGEVDRNGEPLYYLPPTVVFVDSWALVTPKDIVDEEDLSGYIIGSFI